MDEAMTSDSDTFFDASDEWSSFDDDPSQVSQIDSLTNEPPDEVTQPSDSHGSSAYFDGWHADPAGPGIAATESEDPQDSPLGSEIVQTSEATSLRRRRKNFLSESEGSESPHSWLASERISNQFSRNDEDSSLSDGSDELIGEMEAVESLVRDVGISSSGFLEFVTGLVVKAILFQINMVVSLITAPIWILKWCIMLVFHPFYAFACVKDCFLQKLSRCCGYVLSRACFLVNYLFMRRLPIGRYAAKFGWGCIRSVYIGIVLVGILVLAIATSGFIMKWFVEEPLRMREPLNFDYTKVVPVAFVPVSSCDGISNGQRQSEKVDDGKWAGFRVIGANHNLNVEVALTLPESDYNRKLGVFQVKVDFLSTSGKVTAGSRHPCMLRFKSSPIRHVETFLKSGSLIAGYSSESQTVNLRMRGVTEGGEPTACVRVALESRAEFTPGAGIPQIDSASFLLESQLPLFKWILWNWKNTIFIWLSMWICVVELLFLLLCCRQVLF